MNVYQKLKEYVVADYLPQISRFHDRSRVMLLFNIAFATILLGLLATITTLILGTYPVLVPALGNVAFGVLALVILKQKRLQLAAHSYFLVLFCLLFGNLNFNPGTMHIGSPFWVMLLNILVIYILGIRWGILYLCMSLLGFLYYLHFVFPETIKIVSKLPRTTYFSAYYETAFALFLLAYIIATILRASRDSDRLMQQQNAELIQQNARIKSSDEEKTVMLKEIHHRVKNNLQVIISLLRLQMRELKQKEAISKFRDTINRVLTMSMIHEKIYQSEELSRVNLEKYFDSLSKDLKASYQVDYDVDIQYIFEVDKIGLKSIVPLALIFNELFSNSLKHAFNDQEHPRIAVSLLKLDDRYFIFDYTDNGTWKDTEDANSFGLELIASLTDQLEGEMEFTKMPHTHYRFKIKHLEM